MIYCNNLENIPSDICMKVQADSSLEPPLEKGPSQKGNSDESRQVMILLTNLGLTLSCSFRLALEGKTGKEINESSTFEFLQKFSATPFNLSDVEANTSGH